MARYAFQHGIIIDGTRAMEPLEGKAVLVNGDRIEAIIDPSDIPSSCTCIDLKGKYLLPGLINMHVHLAGNGGNGSPQKQRDNAKLVRLLFSNPLSAAAAHALVASYAKTQLMSGVTTIRTVGGLKDLDTRVRDEIAIGKRVGPRILAANMAVSVPGGHMAGSVATESRSIEEAVEAASAAINERVDLVKVMITGGVLDAKEKGTPGEMKMRPEMVRAICKKAHAYGLPVAAHVESTEGVRVALQNGVDSVEHGAQPTEEIVDLFKSTGSSLTCTLSPTLPYALFDRTVSGASEIEQYNGQIVFEGIRDMAQAALDNGIPLALGNDVGCPWITQYDFWRELVYLTKFTTATPQDALYAATLGGATCAGIDQEAGSVEAGKCADLIVVNDNPLENLTTLRNVEMVMTRGRLIEHPTVKRTPAIDAQLDRFL